MARGKGGGPRSVRWLRVEDRRPAVGRFVPVYFEREGRPMVALATYVPADKIERPLTGEELFDLVHGNLKDVPTFAAGWYLDEHLETRLEATVTHWAQADVVRAVGFRRVTSGSKVEVEP